MNCAWDAFMRLIPQRFRDEVDKLGRDALQEFHLRLGSPPLLICNNKKLMLPTATNAEDMQFCINAASGYSPWAASTIANGYITAPGGHRVGVCGEAVMKDHQMTGIRIPTSICIRVARDFSGISEPFKALHHSVLIIGSPGCGKTTLLRDLIRRYSDTQNRTIGVVDEREELFPHHRGTLCFEAGHNTDILSGCGKQHGIELLLRCMGPSAIAVDEITAEEDCNALLQAAWCGVTLYATAHAGSKKDLYSRPVYRPVIERKVFDSLIVMRPDKSWIIERMSG